MAEEKSPLTPEQQAEYRHSRKKIRTIRIWLWVIALLFLGFGLLSRCALSPSQASARIVESCVKNMPFAPQWESDLAKHGLTGQTERVIEPFCRCVWEAPLSKISHEDLRHFSAFDAATQLEKLGGEQAFLQRQEQCLAAQKQ
ncbi:MAG: hypothetical protein Q4A62_08340 [Eikenella sp.]|nr:hypothetical protein [Eikenella sp.]